MNWKPIETADKSKSILAFFPKMDFGGQPLIIECCWEESRAFDGRDLSKWVFPETCFGMEAEPRYHTEQPTHWMERPEHPQP